MAYLLPPIAEVHDVSHERGVVERRPESHHSNAQPLVHGRERVLAVPELLCTLHITLKAMRYCSSNAAVANKRKASMQKGRLCRTAVRPSRTACSGTAVQAYTQAWFPTGRAFPTLSPHQRG